MSEKLFNSIFEMELRILLLLSETKGICSLDRIIYMDFITCYSADFNLSSENLHGKNGFKYGEMSNRRILAKEAIKELVTKGFVKVTVVKGYYFSMAELGNSYVAKLESSYAKEYRSIANIVEEKYGKVSDSELLREIQLLSITSLKGEEYVLHK